MGGCPHPSTAGCSGTVGSSRATLRESGEGGAWIQLQAAWSPPEWHWRPRAVGEGVCTTEAAPPPAHQCPPLSGRRWPPLPLEKRLFSFPAADGGGWTGGGRCTEVLGHPSRRELALSTPPSLHPARFNGREGIIG